MSTFLINASNLKAGGGLQVAQSICKELKRINKHCFIVVLSSYFNAELIEFGDNVEVFRHNVRHNLKTILTQRDCFLDWLVTEKQVDAVLTVFGPSLWRPRSPHLCGFARAQLLLQKDSPYRKRISFKEKVVYKIWTLGFLLSSTVFYTENPQISFKLPSLIRGAKVYTVSNYYNQVFDYPELWTHSINLPSFEGITCLSVSSPAPHKNIGIIEGVVRYLRYAHPGFNVRFVLTFNPENWPMAEDVRSSLVYIGKVDVSECPNLYQQSDIMFMPTLTECFSATYPEAMRMEKPIITPDLDFAHGICGDAACYYSAVDAHDAGEAIFRVASDDAYAKQLVENGRKRLLSFDNYEQRADKLVKILEELARAKG